MPIVILNYSEVTCDLIRLESYSVSDHLQGPPEEGMLMILGARGEMSKTNQTKTPSSDDSGRILSGQV